MKTIQFIYIFVTLLMLGSCQKVITVNLNSSNPRFVIEGSVVDSQAQHFVTITKSINFDQDNTFPTVSGALVIITDVTAQVADTLKETTPGTYATSKINGTPGHMYQLYIKSDSAVFTASSTMPAVVTLDSLYVQQSGFRGGNYSLVPVYTDPVMKGNYYQFIEFINDTESTGIYVANDALINGQVMNQPLRGRGSDSDPKVMLGSNVKLYMYCIDSATYQYFYTLQQTKNQNSATPANPQSNIKGGALGYFSAHTSVNRSMIVQ